MDAWYVHFGFGHAALNVCLLASGETGHEDTFGAAAGRNTSSALGCMEQVEHHADNFRLHLAHAREDIWVNRVGNSEHAKCVRLELEQVVAAVVDSAGDKAVFPAGVVHVSQGCELGTDRFFGNALLWQRKIPCLCRRGQLC